MRQFLLLIALIILAGIFAGCSSSGSPLTPDRTDTPATAMSESDAYVLFCGEMEIYLDRMEIAQKEARQAEMVYNITGFLPDKCPGGCFRFQIVNLVGTVLEIDLTIENPTTLQVYDVRIQYNNLFGKTVLNPDSYTDFLGTPSDIKPFTAFAKEISDRAFPVGPSGVDTETLFLDFPPGAQASVHYAITASLPGNTEEPYEVGEMMQDGELTPSGGNATISCRVYDHQGDNIKAELDAIPFTGGIEQMLEETGNPGIFKVDISNTMGAPVGSYMQLIKSFSPNPQYIYTYNFVEIMVTDEAGDVIYVDNSYLGPDSDGTMSRPFVTITDGMNAALPGWQVWVDDSGMDYDEYVSVYEGVTLKSVNWDPLDGTDMASIYRTFASVVYMGSDNAEIDGFKIYGSDSTGLTIAGNNCTVRNCWITEIIKTADSGIVEGIRVSNADGALITDNEFSNLQLNADSGIIDCIYNMAATNVTIQRNKIHNMRRNTESGILIPIYFNTCDGVTFKNNLIYDIVSSSASITTAMYFNTTINSVVENNVITGLVNGDGSAAGIGQDDESFNWNGRNNIIANFVGTDMYLSEPGAIWEYNNVWNCGSGSPPAGLGNIVEDPMFVDPMGDFHLMPGSLCIDAGDPMILDYDSTRSDMGCYGGPLGDW